MASTSTPQNTTVNEAGTFRFLDLPGEMRNMVYKFALAPDPTTNKPAAPGLLQACRLIYNEAHPALYTQNNITISLCDNPQYLEKLPQCKRRLLRQITIVTSWESDAREFAYMATHGLRYCSGLKTLTIKSPSTFYRDKMLSCSDSIEWVPRGCRVVLDGPAEDEFREYVEKVNWKSANLDEKTYSQRRFEKK